MMKKSPEQLRKERGEIVKHHLEAAIRYISKFELDADGDFDRSEAINEINTAMEWLEEVIGQ